MLDELAASKLIVGQKLKYACPGQVRSTFRKIGDIKYHIVPEPDWRNELDADVDRIMLWLGARTPCRKKRYRPQ